MNIDEIVDRSQNPNGVLNLSQPVYLPIPVLLLTNDIFNSRDVSASLQAVGFRLATVEHGSAQGRNFQARADKSHIIFVDSGYEGSLEGFPKEKIVVVDGPGSSHITLSRHDVPKSQRQRVNDFDVDIADREEDVMGTRIMDIHTFRTLYEQQTRPLKSRFKLESFRPPRRDDPLAKLFGGYLSDRPFELLEQRLRSPTTDVDKINASLDLVDVFVALGKDKAKGLSKYLNGFSSIVDKIEILDQSLSFMLQCYHGKLGGDMSFVYKERGMGYGLPTELDTESDKVREILEENYLRFRSALSAIAAIIDDLELSPELPELNSAELRKYKVGIEHALDPDNPQGLPKLLEDLAAIPETDNQDQLLEHFNHRHGISKYMRATKFLKAAVDTIALYAGLASFFIDHNWTRPQVLDPSEKRIYLENCWNPLIQDDQEPTPHSVQLGPEGYLVEIVEGANKAGKTVYLIEVPVAMNFIQSGFYAPCEKAVVSPQNRIFVRLKKTGSIKERQSAYGAELEDTRLLLSHIRDYEDTSLVCLDEWYTSTRFDDGQALLAGLIEGEFVPKGVKAIITTHFPNLTQLREIPGVSTFYFPSEVNGGRVTYPYTKLPSNAELQRPHYGLIEARASGLPESMLTIAQQRIGSK